MSKFAITFCAVLLALAANADVLSETLEIFQQEAQRVINAAILRVQEKSEATKEEVREIGAKLSQKTTEYNNKFWEEILLTVQKARGEVDDFAFKAEGVTITECKELVSKIVVAANSFYNKTKVCTARVLETRLGPIKKINNFSDNALAKLTKIREEAQQCVDNVHDQKCDVAAVLCPKAAGIKAKRASNKYVRVMSFRITNFALSIYTLQPSLANCTRANAVSTFHRKSSAVVERIKTCIQRKIKEAARPSQS